MPFLPDFYAPARRNYRTDIRADVRSALAASTPPSGHRAMLDTLYALGIGALFALLWALTAGCVRLQRGRPPG